MHAIPVNQHAGSCDIFIRITITGKLRAGRSVTFLWATLIWFVVKMKE